MNEEASKKEEKKETKPEKIEVKEEEKVKETPISDILRQAIEVPKRRKTPAVGYTYIACLLLFASLMTLFGIPSMIAWLISAGISIICFAILKYVMEKQDVAEFFIAGLILVMGGLGELFHLDTIMWILGIGFGFLILAITSK